MLATPVIKVIWSSVKQSEAKRAMTDTHYDEGWPESSHQDMINQRIVKEDENIEMNWSVNS